MVRTWKNRLLIGAVAGAVVVGSSAVALAYFSGSGSGTGNASVGSASPFTVVFGTATGGPVYPGAGAESLPYTVTNPGTGAQKLTATSSSVASSGGNVTHGGVAVPGCLASWFTASNTPPVLGSLVHAATATGVVLVTMQDSGTDQSACQGIAPDIIVAAS